MKTFEQFINEYAQLPQNMMDNLTRTLTPVLKQNGVMTLPVPQRVLVINAVMTMLDVNPEQYKMFNALATQQPIASNPFANQSQNIATQTMPVQQ